VPDYFDKTRLLRAYVSENYRTAVILTDEAEGVYLDKFAVLDEAQGEGLGRAVWNVMREETPQLFWRSRHGNQSIFYYAESDGCYKQDKWKTFWFGAMVSTGSDLCRPLRPAHRACRDDRIDHGRILDNVPTLRGQHVDTATAAARACAGLRAAVADGSGLDQLWYTGVLAGDAVELCARRAAGAGAKARCCRS
jgi:GNAT superfamily N-acetyltransferase